MILNFLLFESIKNIKDIVKKYNIDTESSEYKLIASKLKNHQNLIGSFLDFKYSSNIGIDRIEKTINWILNYPDLVKKLSKPIVDFENFEDLEDRIQEVIDESKIQKFYKSLYKTMQKQIDNAGNNVQKQFKNLALSFMDLPEEKRKAFTPLKYFEINNISLSEFLLAIEEFIKRGSVADEKERVLSIIEKFKNTVDILYDQNNILVIRTLDGEAVKELGSNKWCIVYSPENYQKTYFGKETFNTQFIVWDFNLPSYNENSQFGITLDMKRQVVHGGCQNKLNKPVDIRYIKNTLNIPSDVFKVYTENYDNFQKERKEFLELIKNEKIIEALNYINNAEYSKLFWDKNRYEKFGEFLHSIGKEDVFKNFFDKISIVDFYKKYRDTLKGEFYYGDYLNFLDIKHILNCCIIAYKDIQFFNREKLKNIKQYTKKEIIKYIESGNEKNDLFNDSCEKRLTEFLNLKNYFNKQKEIISHIDVNEIGEGVIIDLEFEELVEELKNEILDNSIEIKNFDTWIKLCKILLPDYNQYFIENNIISDKDVYKYFYDDINFKEYIKNLHKKNPDWELDIIGIDEDNNYEYLEKSDFEDFIFDLMKEFGLPEKSSLHSYIYFKKTKSEDPKHFKIYDDLLLKKDENNNYYVQFDDYDDLSDYFENKIDLNNTYEYFNYNSSDFDWSQIYDDLCINFIIPLGRYLYDNGEKELDINIINKYDKYEYYKLPYKEKMELFKTDKDLKKLQSDIEDILNGESENETDIDVESITGDIARAYTRAQESADESELFDDVINRFVNKFKFSEWEDGKYTKWIDNKLAFKVSDLGIMDDLTYSNIYRDYGVDFSYDNLMSSYIDDHGKISIKGEYYGSIDDEYLNEEVIEVSDSIPSEYFEKLRENPVKTEESLKFLINYKNYRLKF